MDGLRRQEFFDGADRRLMNSAWGSVKDLKDLQQRYDHDDPREARKALMPFFGSTVATEGQVLGDPDYNSTATATNGNFSSYRGYSEILCGFGNPAIDSNDKACNKNVTVLE